MVNFQQISEWFNSIFTLSQEVEPIIREIKDGVKTKTVDGIQFIDFEQPALSNIRQLNQILRDNGLDEIDEELLGPALVDIENVLQMMQQDFTEDELARAIEQQGQPIETPDFGLIEFELADVCAPTEIEGPEEFSEKELIDAACDPPKPTDADIVEVSQLPTTAPKENLQLDEPKLPEASDETFAQLLEEARNAPVSDLFPSNGPDCIEKMKEIASSVQQKVNAYTDIKKKIQEIQLDYYYETIADAYYQSFLDGYGEVNRIKQQISEASSVSTAESRSKVQELQSMLMRIKEESAFASDKSEVQKRLEDAIWSFSNQFDIEIESGFLGLFESSPLVKINKEKTPLLGKIKDVPDELILYIEAASKESSYSADDVTRQAKKANEDLENAFAESLSLVRANAFAFGIAQFTENESIKQDFDQEAKSKRESQTKVSARYEELKKEEARIQKDIDDINKQITSELAKMNCKSSETPTVVEAGKDLNFKNVSKNPTIFDYTWWVKFSTLASVVNLVPVHWPIGLLIPTPTGLIRIPFPIVWFPIFVAPTDKLIAVLFIGQCGILPCPYLFLQHFLPIPVGPFQSNNPYFAAAIGGPINISSHEPLPPITIPTFDLVFEAFGQILDSFRRGVTGDVSALLMEVRNQLQQVQNSAQRYLAVSQKDIDAIVQNASRQAAQTVQSAKESAQAAIKQAQEEGQRLIQDARRRYKDANVLSEATLTISRGVQEKISEANRLLDDARRFANDINLDAQAQATALKRRADETVKAIIENGKQAYEQKVKEIEQLGQQYNETVKTLRDFINKISIPSIDLGLINLTALLSSYTLALGSLKALAADLSPKAIQFGFPTELSPQFSASLPIFKDELPPWERLSLLNIPLLFFLWKWCKSGKFVGGFLPESIVGPF